jgi:hypothetical protein
MLIHIIGSTRHFDDDAPFMQIMSDTIQASGDNIILNWFNTAKSRHVRQIETRLPSDLQEMVQENEDAIARADGIIVEGSRFNFSQGYQIALALQADKPVLNLYRKNLVEYEQWPDRFFILGIANPLLISQSYANQADLEQTITKFLTDIRPTSKQLDVELTLNQETYQRLAYLADKSGKSKGSIIKDIVTKNIQI